MNPQRSLIVLVVALCGMNVRAAERQPVSTIEAKGGVIAVAPTNNIMAIGADYRGPLSLVELAKANRTQVLEKVSATFVTLDFSPNGKLLAALRVSLDPPENNLSVWDVDSKTKLWETREGVHWAVFAPDGNSIAVGKFNVVRFFDSNTGAVLQDISAHSAANVEQGAYSANGKIFVTAGEEDHLVHVWDAQSGNLELSFNLPGERITKLAVSDNGSWIATSQNNILSVFDGKTGQKKWSHTDGEESIMGLAFAPKSSTLAAGNHDGHVSLWDASAGQKLESLQPEHGMVQSVAYSTDGSKLFVGASAATLVYSTAPADAKAEQVVSRLWKSANGKFKLSARFAGLDGAHVRLIRDQDGKEVKVPLAQLSPADQEFAKQLASAAKQLKYSIHNYDWSNEKQAVSIPIIGNGLSFLSEIAGDFNGPTRVEVTATKQPTTWSLSGKSEGAFLVAKATSIDDMRPVILAKDATEFQWAQNDPPVKMIHKSEGFCYLAGIGGAFRGYGETVEVKINDDGYWYLSGRSAQPQLWAKAIAVKWAKPDAVSMQIEERTWKVGDEAIDLLLLKDGLCFFSAISGNFAGGGEIIRITHDEDRWLLNGQSGQAELSARAMMIKLDLK